MDLDSLYKDKLFMYTIMENDNIDQVLEGWHEVGYWAKDSMDVQDLVQVFLKVYGYLNEVTQLRRANQWESIWIRRVLIKDYEVFLNKYNVPYLILSVSDHQKSNDSFFNLSATLPDIDVRYKVLKFLI